MKISVNSSLCEGYGNCARIAPDVFELDESGYSQVANGGEVPSEHEAAARHAVDDCPMTAIDAIE